MNKGTTKQYCVRVRFRALHGMAWHDRVFSAALEVILYDTILSSTHSGIDGAVYALKFMVSLKCCLSLREQVYAFLVTLITRVCVLAYIESLSVEAIISEGAEAMFQYCYLGFLCRRSPLQRDGPPSCAADEVSRLADVPSSASCPVQTCAAALSLFHLSALYCPGSLQTSRRITEAALADAVGDSGLSVENRLLTW